MAKKTNSKSAKTVKSSWWDERSKVLAKTDIKPAKSRAKKAKAKKARAAEKGGIYFCDSCGCELVCVEPSEEPIVCCDEPMMLLIR